MSSTSQAETFDVIVLGAGAAGLFCAGEAARRGKRVLALDHASKIGEKIRISGGGRCNFTNINASPQNFLSENPKFCVSALKRFTPQDFIARVDAAGIAWHEKHLGQLFCDGSAQQIIDMLIDDCRTGGVLVRAGVAVESVQRDGAGFLVTTSGGIFAAPALVIATGGKSIPKIGATGFGYDLARQFGLRVVEPRAGLVPLVFDGAEREMASALAGVSVDCTVTTSTKTAGRRPVPAPAFKDGFLFTHRGLSGPSILQISSYWREGAEVIIDFAPGADAFAALREARGSNGRQGVATALSGLAPKRLAASLAEAEGWRGNIADWSDAALKKLAKRFHGWRVTPSGSEGYRTAEVTVGGVDTSALNSRTMEANSVPGLYFVGEVVDVTGWLGGVQFSMGLGERSCCSARPLMKAVLAVKRACRRRADR